MKRLSIIGFVVALCLTILLVGCSFSQTVPKAPEQTGYEVKDYQGDSVRLSGKPQKIVSLTLGTDEILLSLVTPNRLAALTYLVDDPGISNVTEGAKQVPGRVKANLESVIALKPDLVIVANWQPLDFIKSIKDAGIPVYVYKTPSTIGEIESVIKELAVLVGEEPKGAEIVANMDENLLLVKERVKNVSQDKKKVVIRYILTGATYGKGSLFDDICHYANVENGVAKAGGNAFEELPKEKIIAVNPDIFILPGWDFTGKMDINTFKNQVREDPAFQSVQAVKENQLIIIPDKYMSPTSQYIILGVKEIAQAAYPE